MRKLLQCLLLSAVASTLPGATVSWTEWKTKGAGTMSGEITLPDLSTVTVTFTGTHYFTNPAVSQLSGEGQNLWTAGPDTTYLSSTVENRPPLIPGWWLLAL